MMDANNSKQPLFEMPPGKKVMTAVPDNTNQHLLYDVVDISSLTVPYGIDEEELAITEQLLFMHIKTLEGEVRELSGRSYSHDFCIGPDSTIARNKVLEKDLDRKASQ